jgi:hypothetical protein
MEGLIEKINLCKNYYCGSRFVVSRRTSYRFEPSNNVIIAEKTSANEQGDN